MNIKSRIWSLPAISVIIFTVGIAASSYFANLAQRAIERTGAVDYAILAQSQILRTDVQARPTTSRTPSWKAIKNVSTASTIPSRN